MVVSDVHEYFACLYRFKVDVKILAQSIFYIIFLDKGSQLNQEFTGISSNYRQHVPEITCVLLWLWNYRTLSIPPSIYMNSEDSDSSLLGCMISPLILNHLCSSHLHLDAIVNEQEITKRNHVLFFSHTKHPGSCFPLLLFSQPLPHSSPFPQRSSSLGRRQNRICPVGGWRWKQEKTGKWYGGKTVLRD